MVYFMSRSAVGYVRFFVLSKYFLFTGTRNILWEKKKPYHTEPYRLELSGVDIGLKLVLEQGTAVNWLTLKQYSRNCMHVR